MKTPILQKKLTQETDIKMTPVHSFVTVSTKKAQINHIDTPKVSFLKKLLISSFSIPYVERNDKENIYMISTPLYNSSLFLVENILTNSLSLHQDNYMLSDNQSICSIILSKIKEKPGY